MATAPITKANDKTQSGFCFVSQKPQSKRGWMNTFTFWKCWEQIISKMVQTKNKVFTFAEFLGLFLFLRRFALNISKKWMYQLNRSLSGAFWSTTKPVLSFDLRFCDWGCVHWPLFLKNANAKIRFGGPKSGWTLLLSSNCWKTSLDLWRFFQREKEKRLMQFAAKRK